MASPSRPRAQFLRRPSRRTILTASLLLLAGAVVNVVLAWVLVGAPYSWRRDWARFQSYSLRHTEPDQLETVREQLQRVAVFAGAPPDAPVPYVAGVQRTLGRTVTHAFASSDGPSRWTFVRCDGGWPARSMTVLDRRTPTGRYLSPSLELPRRLLPNKTWFRGWARRVPLMPIPAGFAMNTVFYAAILALPLSFFPIRRCLRARRCRCQKCGYDLAGVESRPCPECGSHREPSGRSPMPTRGARFDPLSCLCGWTRRRYRSRAYTET